MSHFMAKSLVGQFLHILLLLFISQKPYLANSSKNDLNGFSLKFIHRDSPESPSYPGHLTPTQKLERFVTFSQERARYLSHTINPSKYNETEYYSPEEAKMYAIRNNYYYIVMTAFGTPPVDLYLIMDTAGGLVWTQCMPCIKCYTQTVPLFDSAVSLSYRKLPCTHFLCNGGPRSKYQCINNECVYTVGYGGGGTGPTKGIASIETIWFLLSNGGVQPIDGITFGCSNDNNNFYNLENTPISGVMGLSWSPDSLVDQLAPYIHRKFSYCIIPFYLDWPETGSVISFGNAIPLPTGNLQTTRFVPPSGGVQKYYFYLNLLDISIGWADMKFPPDTFKINPDGSGGMMIDSGAPATCLMNLDLPNGRNPYKEVLDAFRRYYDEKGLHRRTDVTLLELCYDNPPGFVDFVTMTYHFDGADYVIEGKNVNYYDKQQGYFCVALTPNSGISILGAWHQQNTRFIFNGDNYSLQFGSEDCTLGR